MGNAYYQDQASAMFYGDAKMKQPNKGQPNKFAGGKVKHDADFKEVQVTNYTQKEKK
jgi:hypothetical protein